MKRSLVPKNNDEIFGETDVLARGFLVEIGERRHDERYCESQSVYAISVCCPMRFFEAVRDLLTSHPEVHDTRLKPQATTGVMSFAAELRLKIDGPADDPELWQRRNDAAYFVWIRLKQRLAEVIVPRPASAHSSKLIIVNFAN
jgi:hypothetical protein